MRRLMYFRLATKDVHLPKLVGAFIVFAAVLMFLRAGAHMFDSWNAVKGYPNCIQNPKELIGEDNVAAELQYIHCKDALYKITGVQVRGDQEKLSTSQFFAALLGPIAEFLGWAVILVLGIIFYRTGNIVVPIEEVVREVKDWPKKK